MKKIYAIFFALAMSSHPIVAAERGEHWVHPIETENHNGYAFPTLIYEYGPDGVEVSFDIYASYWPTDGNIEFNHYDGQSAETDLSFHTFDGARSNLFTPIVNRSWFRHRYSVGFLSRPGHYDVDLKFENDTASAFSTYDLVLPSFDFYETMCRSGKDVTTLDFTVFALENLPPTLDQLIINLGDGKTIDLQNVSWKQNGVGKFGYINVTFQRYKALLAGRELLTTFVIRGESVKQWVYYPPVENTRPNCQRG